MKNLIAICLVSVIALGLGIYFGQSQTDHKTAGLQGNFELPDIEKKLRKSDEWLGKVVVVNHWAAWCAPCRKEIPLLIEYQNQYANQGLQIVGIAHDTLEPTQLFSDEMGINYPSLLAIVGGGEIMARQGGPREGYLPFTAVFDKEGNLVRTKTGELTSADLSEMILPYL